MEIEHVVWVSVGSQWLVVYWDFVYLDEGSLWGLFWYIGVAYTCLTFSSPEASGGCPLDHPFMSRRFSHVTHVPSSPRVGPQGDVKWANGLRCSDESGRSATGELRTKLPNCNSQAKGSAPRKSFSI